MRFRLATVAALTAGVTLAAALAAHVVPRPPASPAVAAPLDDPPAAEAPGERSVVGTIQKYDAASRQLVLTTGKTSLAFRVPDDATIRQGSRRLKAEDLAAHRGERVKLRYSESAGQRRADWIIIAPSPRPPKNQTM